MDVEKSSLCNCVVNFLLEENYLLSAFELLHELLDDGRDAQAIRLKNFFSDHSHFPPDQISRLNSLRVLDPQSLLEEKESVEEKLAIAEYELRLVQEDLLKAKTELQKKTETMQKDLDGSSGGACVSNGPTFQRRKGDASLFDLGSLKDNERQDLNCAVKEYLLLAGYRLTAMTFYEEVSDQNLDVWQQTPARVPDALRHYYYQYLSSKEKIAMLRETEALQKNNERLNREKESLLNGKEVADGQIMALTKSLEALQKDLKDREILVQDLKLSLDHQRKELNDCRAEITALKMHMESGRSLLSGDSQPTQLESLESYREEIKSLKMEVENLKLKNSIPMDSEGSANFDDDCTQMKDNVLQTHENKAVISQQDDAFLGLLEHPDAGTQPLDKSKEKPKDIDQETTGLGTVQILSDALPKIVPYVLINHREELLPLMMCAIERHPDSSTRDSLTHTLFNLIKRPDGQQRQVIMDACVNLAKNVGEMRTETELLPQCWEQINHMYEERRLLVAQSCGLLAEFVRPEIRDSLILSIVQQLIEDSATVVREAAAHNLALLLPLFPNKDKYFKVEEMMFQLVCDPSGLVVETTLNKLVPAAIKWGDKLDHVLQVLLSHILGSAQRCPPLSGVEGSVESHLRALGERERWNVDVLLRLLSELLPSVQQKAVDTCPYPSVSDLMGMSFSASVLQIYARGHMQWPAFDWMHADCLPHLIQLACLLPLKEDKLRHRITKYLLAVVESFGDCYLTHIMLPVFLVAVGDTTDLTYLPSDVQPRINGLRPKTAVAESIASMCVLPLLLAGVLGSPTKQEELAVYLRKLLVEGAILKSDLRKPNTEIFNSVRFLCTFEEHHVMVFNILWEMVVSSDINLKIGAANLLKVIVPCVDVKVASSRVLPALVTLGSDQNLNVKYASIEAFGAVAQHFKSDVIVDKIRVQMDAFLEDGSHEATIAVVRALVLAVPLSTDKLREYLLSKIFLFTGAPISVSDMVRRHDRANAFCEAIRALDATDLSVTNVREYLLPAIQNLLKDTDALDPAHKEALEIILKERSGGTFEAFSKVMGAHLPSVTSFFGEGGLLGKKESGEQPQESVESPKPPLQTQAEDTRFRRIMRGNFTEMLKRQG